eukprot:15431384-Alexandrium_andersonii.AAC.1
MGGLAFLPVLLDGEYDSLRHMILRQVGVSTTALADLRLGEDVQLPRKLLALGQPVRWRNCGEPPPPVASEPRRKARRVPDSERLRQAPLRTCQPDTACSDVGMLCPYQSCGALVLRKWPVAGRHEFQALAQRQVRCSGCHKQFRVRNAACCGCLRKGLDCSCALDVRPSGSLALAGLASPPGILLAPAGLPAAVEAPPPRPAGRPRAAQLTLEASFAATQVAPLPRPGSPMWRAKCAACRTVLQRPSFTLDKAGYFAAIKCPACTRRARPTDVVCTTCGRPARACVCEQDDSPKAIPKPSVSARLVAGS